ncbi:MAG: nucleotide sugar dehydrogenase [Gemmatimonadetes bacterium]|nr:nucleotide sugar dehydrogenase [Gemmatimonadota bacterium]MYA63707.1 nucleotide sugar dehydrogenase [Gemmatimonadota bacterium]MYB99344.1 nucleotide sugar dehydrogenase [Gemmatimonadota bacterium]MYH52355.1 nucleotide sugar dehydrogenase [Gemmatimonadota bacterium]MYI45701.1 nucleotide sugar dehydrogenase [Gemmatimonadota bacterium]
MRSGDATFGVIGLGYVGLPLAVEAARNGIRVLGFDVEHGVVEGVNGGLSHIQDLPHETVADLVRKGLLTATTDMSRLRKCDAVAICVPTPLSRTRDPDISHILAAAEAVGDALVEGQLVVLESTTYPGTTREVVLPILARSGLEAGRDFFLCFSPERVDPGNAVWRTGNTPKIIGGMTPECAKIGAAFYSCFVERMVTVSSVEAAELTKILENAFRAVNIGLVNEMALIADRLGLDIWEVIEAADTKPFGFMKFTPGPGLGGHCLPVDPQYLSWKMRKMDHRTRLIDMASEINAEMPTFVAGKVREALNGVGKPVKGSRILLLGVAYKKDVADVRESPAMDILDHLERDGAEVQYHDPHVPEWATRDSRTLTSAPLTDDLLREADAAVIVTDHSCFDAARILSRSAVVVDARNATAAVPAANSTARPQRWIVKG